MSESLGRFCALELGVMSLAQYMLVLRVTGSRDFWWLSGFATVDMLILHMVITHISHNARVFPES